MYNVLADMLVDVLVDVYDRYIMVDNFNNIIILAWRWGRAFLVPRGIIGPTGVFVSATVGP